MRLSPAKMERGLNLALIKSGNALEKTGKTEHRYKRRSGKLQDDTGYRLEKTFEGFVLNFGFGANPSNSALKYRERIHNGFGTWQPDPFIYDAVNKNENTIARYISEAVNLVIREFR